MRTIAFFNNKGGVGKTSLVYHLAHMFAELGVETLAADLDPQANLTSMFLPEDRLEEIWGNDAHPETVAGALEPLLEGVGDIGEPHVEPVAPRLGLVVGDLALSRAEDQLNTEWRNCCDQNQGRAFRVVSAFWRIVERAAAVRGASLVLLDVGPSLGALNRAALLAAHDVAVPLAPDLYSLQGLQNLGPTLRRWRQEWGVRRPNNPNQAVSLPPGTMEPIGYVVMQHAVRQDRAVRAYGRWMARIPGVYARSVLGEPGEPSVSSVESDPNCLAALRHYRSLMPMAQEARKPMFFLKPADGALGSHVAAVQACFEDFRRLAARLAERSSVALDGDGVREPERGPITPS